MLLRFTKGGVGRLASSTVRSQNRVVSVLRPFSVTSGLPPQPQPENLFLTSIDAQGKNSPITLGLIHELQKEYNYNVGYFRPVTSTSSSDHHVALMTAAFEYNHHSENGSRLYGVTGKQAIRAWLSGTEADVIDEILTTYERLAQHYEFMVIEGLQLAPANHSLAWQINIDVAKALGSPMLLTSDFKSQRFHTTEQFAQEVAQRTSIAQEQLHNRVPVVGLIANRVRVSQFSDRENLPDVSEMTKLVQQTMAEQSQQTGLIPFLGGLPHDAMLRSKRLNEIAVKLNAKQLYGPSEESLRNSITVTRPVVATSELRQFLKHLDEFHAVEKGEGLLVITSADRVDLILGLLVARLSGTISNVAGIILTNGDVPQTQVKTILEGVAKLDRSGMSIPIFTVDEDSYVTANNFSRITCNILPTSVRKIERSFRLFGQHVDKRALIRSLRQLSSPLINHSRTRRNNPSTYSPSQFKHFILNRARLAKKHIVLPEGEDERILYAADECLRKDLVSHVTILTKNEEYLQQQVAQMNLSELLNTKKCTISSPQLNPHYNDFVKRYAELRHHKGVTMEMSLEQMLDVTYFGTMMVETGLADGMVSGACHTSANTIRPALQFIKTQPSVKTVSSVFFMCLEDGVKIYGDCAVNADPTAQQLAEIALSSAETAKAFGWEKPHVALLSYATGDSNQGPIIEKVRQATKIAENANPDDSFYGPIQYDAAVDINVAKKKLKLDSTKDNVYGQADVLIFPDLNTGNNTYKAVQQSTHCVAMGPLLQGLRKPVNDLSRGATVADIVTTIAITAIQAQYMKEQQDEVTD